MLARYILHAKQPLLLAFTQQLPHLNVTYHYIAHTAAHIALYSRYSSATYHLVLYIFPFKFICFSN